MKTIAGKIVFWSSLVALVGVGGALGGVYVFRQWPVSVPQDLASLRTAAVGVMRAKCAACHDAAAPEAWTQKIPVAGRMLDKHRRDGERHFDPFERRYLGAAATAAEKAASPVLLGPLVKLEKALADDSMPLRAYRIVHWGTGLSASERELLTAWIRAERKVQLGRFGIAAGADRDIQPLPAKLPTNAAKVALGKRLYNDKRLSADNSIACATCHDLARGATDNQPVSTGVGGKKGDVNAPTAFNAAFNARQFWDGRAATLADQAGGPPLNPVEMASKDWNEICAKLQADSVLRADFLKCYPEGFSGESICAAIAEYEKTLLTPNDAFDRFLNGDEAALTDLEKAGYWAFRHQGCNRCHNGPTLGGQAFEYVSLKADYFAGRALTEGDRGLAAFSKDPRDVGRFKVPALRNVALTAPYFHDARQKTLADAVRAMMTFAVGAGANEAEVVALCAFLRALTGVVVPSAVTDSHWKGKKVAFLGDSITDPRQPNRIYWQFLAERLGVVPHVCAVSGYRWKHMPAMAERLYAETKGDVDAILIMTGTNDFNGSVPLGAWWSVGEEMANRNGVMKSLKRRRMNFEPGTVRGEINRTFAILRAKFPHAVVVLMTPLHRGYAHFGEKNVQPDESFANLIGLWIDDYAAVVREASDVWSAPVIDLYSDAQLYPNEPAHAPFFRYNGGKDLLHPGTAGHSALADLIARRLMTLPAGYRPQ